MSSTKHVLRVLTAVAVFLISVPAWARQPSTDGQAGRSKESEQTQAVYLPLIAQQRNTLEPVIDPNANVIPAEQLEQVAQDSSVLTITERTAVGAGLTSGDVIVGDVSDRAPNGLLRRVKSVTDLGDKLVVDTEPATLEDAIQQGEVNLNRALTPADVRAAHLLAGVQSRMRTNQAGALIFSVDVQDVVVYDHDGNLNTTNDQVRADGSIEVEPSLQLDIKIAEQRLQHFYFAVTKRSKEELTFKSVVKLDVIQAEKTIARYSLTPVTAFIGPVPIVVVPVLSINIGIDGSVEVGVSLSMNQESTLTAGAEYVNGQWVPVSRRSESFVVEQPRLTTKLDLKGYAGVRISALLYGISGAYSDANLFVKLEADPFKRPWWELYLGVEVPVGVRVELLGKTLASTELVVIQARVLIAQAAVDTATATPTRIASRTPTVAPGSPTPTQTHTPAPATVTATSRPPSATPSTCSAPTIQAVTLTPAGSTIVGNIVSVYARAQADSCFRSMRLKIDGNVVYELGAPEWTYQWNTGSYATGSHTIRIEAAAQGDNNWTSPSVREIGYTLQVGPTATPVPCTAPPIETLNFTTNPTVTVGTSIGIYAKATWNSCFRSMRLKIDGNVVYELGSPEWTYTWNTTGYSSGSHTIRLEVAALGDNSWTSPTTRQIYSYLFAAPVLGKPGLSSPANGALIPPNTSITLNWNAVGGATQYLVEVWGGHYGGTHVAPCGWTSANSCSIGKLTPGNVLWRVMARDGSGNISAWSDEWNFTAQ